MQAEPLVVGQGGGGATTWVPAHVPHSPHSHSPSPEGMGPGRPPPVVRHMPNAGGSPLPLPHRPLHMRGHRAASTAF